jgi:hypothetical protein
MVPALLMIVSFGAFMAALFFRTQGSILPTILAHLSLNVTLGAGGAALSSAVLWWTTGLAYAVIAWVLLPAIQRERSSSAAAAVGTVST